MSLSAAREGPSASTSVIAPVWVSSAANPYNQTYIHVYALLDTQSDLWIWSCELQVDVCPVKPELTTMMRENAVVNSDRGVWFPGEG